MTRRKNVVNYFILRDYFVDKQREIDKIFVNLFIHFFMERTKFFGIFETIISTISVFFEGNSFMKYFTIYFLHTTFSNIIFLGNVLFDNFIMKEEFLKNNIGNIGKIFQEIMLFQVMNFQTAVSTLAKTLMTLHQQMAAA